MRPFALRGLYRRLIIHRNGSPDVGRHPGGYLVARAARDDDPDRLIGYGRLAGVLHIESLQDRFETAEIADSPAATIDTELLLVMDGR